MKKNRVAVLLSSYNGEKYIEEQIISVMCQKNIDVSLYIRDDGSTDKTIEIIDRLANKYNSHIKYELGKNVGVVNSFFTLLREVNGYDYYAFCDQDDVWDENKIGIAIDSLNKSVIPAMYFSTTLPVDSNLVPITKISKKNDECHVFNISEVMIRNNVVGCTMVFNKKLREKILRNIPTRVIMHDHWIYAVCIAIDGDIYYDKTPHIKYRQHDSNVVGNKQNFKSRIKHSSFSKENVKIRSDMAKKIIEEYSDEISSNNKSIIARYAFYDISLIKKLELIKNEIKFMKGIKKKIFFIIEVLVGVY